MIGQIHFPDTPSLVAFLSEWLSKHGGPETFEVRPAMAKDGMWTLTLKVGA